jgi:hypothetical protein
MSAVFIVIYAGVPIRLPSLDLTTHARASRFISEADAWFEVHRARLNPAHCKVVSLSESERLHDVPSKVEQRSEVAK